MQMILLIFFSLIFFIYSIFMLIIVTGYRNRKQTKFLEKVEKHRKTYTGWIMYHLEMVDQGQSMSELDHQRFTQALGDPVFVRVLDEVLVEYATIKTRHETIHKFMNYFKDRVIHNMLKHSNQEGVRHIHRVFQAGIYRLDDPTINQYLLDAMDTNSLYLLHNAIRSIANIGDLDTLIIALGKLSKSAVVLNNKVLQDVLNHYSREKLELYEALLANLRTFSDGVKQVVVDTLRINKYDKATDILFDMIMDGHEGMEVELAIIRYFGVIKDEIILPFLIVYMSYESWEYRAVSATTLAFYNSDDTVEILLKHIGDHNWYVRMNTAQALLTCDVSDEIIINILKGSDPYAKDAMEYALGINKRIVLETDVEGNGVV